MRDVSELVLFVSAFVVAAPGRYYNPYHSELYILYTMPVRLLAVVIVLVFGAVTHVVRRVCV